MIYVITGPTCTGKDAIAIQLAKSIGGEIINADAFHVYKQLDIGTSKPREESFEDVEHHLFDFVSPDDPYSIARYQKDARRVIDELLAKNIPVVMLGGSGLYIKAALFDYQFREEKPFDMSSYDNLTNNDLHQQLVQIDPHSAKDIHPNNRRRVLRALQIYHTQGILKSDIPTQKSEKPIYRCMFFGPDFDRGIVYLRIVERVNHMVSAGLFKEVKSLVDQYGDHQQALHAIGYKEVIEAIHGEVSKEEAVQNIITNTRHYAKRQITFVRNQFAMHWVKSVDDIIRIANHGKTS